MSRPRVALDNYKEVYDYYQNRDANVPFARLGHLMMSKVYQARVETISDDVRDATADTLRVGGRLMIWSNHLTGDDQYALLAMVEREKVLHPLRGKLFIPAETSLFSRDGLGGHLLRVGVDAMGAIPTVRRKDPVDPSLNLSPEDIEALFVAATQRASEVQVVKLIRGKHAGGFPEGTRNRIDHRELQTLKDGMAYTAIAAAQRVPVSIVPVGNYYGGEPKDYMHPEVPGKHHPTVTIGMPIPVSADDIPRELTDRLHPLMQACVDNSVLLAA